MHNIWLDLNHLTFLRTELGSLSAIIIYKTEFSLPDIPGWALWKFLLAMKCSKKFLMLRKLGKR